MDKYLVEENHKHKLIQTDYKGYGTARIGHCLCGKDFLEIDGTIRKEIKYKDI